MWRCGRCGGLGVLPERKERLGPEPIKVLLDDSKAPGIQLVDTTRPLAIVSNQQRRLEYGEMLRHSGPGDVELPGEFTNGHRSFEEEPREDGAAGAVTQGVELHVFVSAH